MSIIRLSQLSAAVLIIYSGCCFSQAKSKKIKVYNAIVSTSLQKKKMKGRLQQVTDSSIFILSGDQRIRIASNVIQKLKIKRKGSVGRGALAGGMSGILLGLIIGFSGGDDTCDGTAFCIYATTAEEKALGAGIALGATGAVLGVIIGSLHRSENILIRGNQDTFHNNVAVIQRYTLTVGLP